MKRSLTVTLLPDYLYQLDGPVKLLISSTAGLVPSLSQLGVISKEQLYSYRGELVEVAYKDNIPATKKQIRTLKDLLYILINKVKHLGTNY